MGLAISNVNIETTSRIPLTGLWVEVIATILEKPTMKVKIILKPFYDELASSDGSDQLRISSDDIPQELFTELEYPLSSGQYQGTIMTLAHTQLRQLLGNGDSDPQFQNLFPGLVWSGLGINNIVIEYQ